MASKRSIFAIAAFVFIAIFLIVILVMISLTYNEVIKSKPPVTTLTSSTTKASVTTNTEKHPSISTQKENSDSTAGSTTTGIIKTTAVNPTTTGNEQSVKTTAAATSTSTKSTFNPTTVTASSEHIETTTSAIIKVTTIPTQITTTPISPKTMPTTVMTPSPTTTPMKHSEATTSNSRRHTKAEYIAAEYLLSNMDQSYHPCDDFYKFACGNFTTNHCNKNSAIGYSTFDIVTKHVGDIIHENLLKTNLSNPDLPDWRVKVKRFYDSCTSSNQTGHGANLQLLKYIEEFGGWPMIMERGTWDEKKFDLAKVLATLTSTFSVQTLVSAGVDLDWKNPDRYMVQLDQSELALGNPEYYSNKKFIAERRAYVEMIRESAAILAFDQNMPQDDERVKWAAQAILDFETLLANHIVSVNDRQNFSKMYNTEILPDIQITYTFLNWTNYFDTLLPSDIVSHYNGPFNIVEPGFMEFLNETLSKTYSKEFIANYLVWRLIYSMNVVIDFSLQRTQEKLWMLTEEISMPNSKREDDCVSLMINNLGFAASRLLLEGSLEENQLNIKEVINISTALKDAFKGQLDTLFWMDQPTRMIAKNKLDEYVELIGFPSWIENNEKLDEYYKSFIVYFNEIDFIKNYVSALTFYEESRFRVLAVPQPKRDTWILPPAITGTWYQPDFNSVTFPMGLFRPPFLKHDFPKAVNYGALGNLMGNAITQGLDNVGAQFNGTGYLETWMSINSQIGYKRMIDCIIRQYDRTCYSQVDMCIDGIQTQRQNSADNGAVREAYNAYRKYTLEHGEESRLPGLEEFSMEQIFFISFANVYCGDFESKEYLHNKIVNSGESPSQARVLNTLKNFGEFGKVFECQVGQQYYPFRSEVCYIWESPPVSKSPEYNNTAQRLLSHMNAAISPCNDFFEHACGNYNPVNPPKTGVTSFSAMDILQNDVYLEIIQNFEQLPTLSPKSIQNAKIYFDICRQSNDTESANNTEILNVLTELGGWPALGDAMPGDYDATYISAQIGTLSSNFGIQTLFVAMAIVDPKEISRRVLAIDQSSLALGSREYYSESKLKNVSDAYYDLIVEVILLLGISKGLKISHQEATDSATSIFSFERHLALMVRPESDRRNITGLYNLYNLTEAEKFFQNVNWQAYLDSLVNSSAPLMEYFSNPNASIIISEPAFVQQLGDFVARELEEDNTILQNYLMWRFIYARLNFMDTNIKKLYTNFLKLKQGVDNMPPIGTACVDQLSTMLPFTIGRLYVNDWEPRGDTWLKLAANMISDISNAFDKLIPELDWLDQRSIQGAKTKLNNLVQNAGYPEWIKDDTVLDNYYSQYTIDASSSYFDVFNQLNQFALAKAFEAILDPVHRRDFQMSPAIVNAMYNPALNSLTVPAAFLNPPFYHPEYPTSVNYGAIGAVMGHELLHSFDGIGIQFDGIGFLNSWMTQYSLDSYKSNIIECIVNQYNHFCHIDGNYCVNGEKTQNENIADNGGIRQAFNAYRNNIRKEMQNKDHSNELLPGMEWYTDDQLFFLSYAQLFCGNYSEQYVKRQIVSNSHSPDSDRVKGAVQNFDEFDKAFHCAVRNPMNPEDKCYIWANPVDATEGYNNAAKDLLESLDPSTRPCDDFYQYSCGGWINQHPIPKDANSISTNSLIEDAILLTTMDSISNVDVNDEDIPDALKKVKQMFDFCIQDTSDINSTSLASFQKFIDEQLYQWPIVTKYWTPTFNGSMQAFNVAGKLESFGLSTLFNAYPQADFTSIEEELRHYVLYLDQASLLLGNREIYLNDKFSDVMTKYKDVLIYTAVKFASLKGEMVPVKTVIPQVEEIIDFETTLARIILPDSMLQNYSLQYNPRTIHQLKTEYINIDFETYFSLLLPAEVLSITDSFAVIVSEPSFLDALNQFLPFTDPRVIQNYLIWRYIAYSAWLFDDDLKAVLNNFKQKAGFIEGIKDDTTICTQDTIDLLPFAAGRLYVEKAFNGKELETAMKARELVVDGLIDQFHLRLKHLDWLDHTSYVQAEKKLDALIVDIGFPHWIFNNTELDELYSLTVDVSTDYYTTKREVSTWFYQTRFVVLNQSIEVHRPQFIVSPASQNAKYPLWLNSIILPAGTLREPYFGDDYPLAVNFGGLGAIAGQALLHGYDNQGVQFGPLGELNYWMTSESANYFTQNISQCVIDQYNQYCYAGLPSGTLCVNGKVTQGENVADNGGTKTAFNAYANWIASHGYEAKLPGMKSFTMYQIFFLNFARSFCEAVTPEALENQLLLDTHSPARDRVIGTLSNMKEFHQAFNCKPGDKMVSKQICNVW